MNITNKIKTEGRLQHEVYAPLKGYKKGVFQLLSKFNNGYWNKTWNVDYLRKHGTLKDVSYSHNLITSAGKAGLAGLAGNVGAVSAFTYLEVGTSTTAPAIGQTALIGAITTNGLQRASASVSRTTTTVTNDTLTLIKTFTVTGSSTVEEAGVFNASSSGVMAGRSLTGTKALSNGDTYVLTYNIIFS